LYRYAAGQKLISEREMGSQLYVVYHGEFDVTEDRHGVQVKVNHKSKGDVFGEISLMFQSPRTANVIATTDASVWVLERALFRTLTRKAAMETNKQHEVFLNSVPILSSLTVEERIKLAEALEEQTFAPGEVVVKQGELDAQKFYIVAKGEAVVTVTEAGTNNKQSDPEGSDAIKKLNHLFRSDFFGEKALLYDRPREATVTASGESPLVCLCLNRLVFTDLLGSLEELMTREKSPEVVARRMYELAGQTPWSSARVMIKGRRRQGAGDVVAAGVCSNATFLNLLPQDGSASRAVDIVLREGKLLGGGASGSVRRVDCIMNSGSMTFALKRMRKCAVMSTPEHIYCEQSITKEVRHFTCMKQHASFQDAHSLYFLFDYMDGCDLMDALATVATVQSIRHPKKPFAPKIKVLKGVPEEMAMYYIAVVTLAFEYLHDNSIVYRDLKPENVLLAMDGTAKLGDFGFAKKLEKGGHTYTFCGTPGYVAPEVVLARGYGTSVDWWGLGVMMYVLLTGQQPFSQIVNGKPEDPLTVMKRIVDRSWTVSYPVYVSEYAVDIMQWFMERRSAKRLGNLRRRAFDIKAHPWFAHFDWELLQSGHYRPRPLALSESFAAQHERRIADLEHEIMASHGMENEGDLREANAIFKDF
jgi:cGMP-dependent protein kinase 2